jgi:hypothetical protein
MVKITSPPGASVTPRAARATSLTLHQLRAAQSVANDDKSVDLAPPRRFWAQLGAQGRAVSFSAWQGLVGPRDRRAVFMPRHQPTVFVYIGGARGGATSSIWLIPTIWSSGWCSTSLLWEIGRK